MPIEPKIRLLVADDQEMVRCGAKALLAGTEVKVVAEAATGQTAVTLALDTEIDLVLLDVRMPDGDGLTVLGRIKLEKPKLPVLLFSAFDSFPSVARAISQGASGFLLKGCSRNELLNAIRRAAAGEHIWSCGMIGMAARYLGAPLIGTLEASLSERECEVLRQVVHGLDNEQIAKAMNVCCETVKQHLKQSFRKIGLASRTQLVLWAIRNDLV